MSKTTKTTTKLVPDVVSDNVKKFSKRTKEALDALRTAVHKDTDTYNMCKENLDKELTSLNSAVKTQVYVQLAESPMPIAKAVATYYITSYKLVEEHDKTTGAIKGLDIAKVTNTRLNIADFVKFAKLDKDWLYKCDQLLALMQLRKTDVYALSEADLLATSPFFIRKANEKLAGNTPDSNTQVVKLLQEIVNETIGNGEQKYKVTIHDIMFIEDAVYSYNRKAECAIKATRSAQFVYVIVSVLFKILNDKAYEVQNNKIKTHD